MSLNGNLEVFPLEEVLRLLSRSRKSGCLRVETGDVHGRIFLSNGAVTLATTAEDDEIKRRLVAGGFVEEDGFRTIELSGASVAENLAADVPIEDFSDFVREESVEGLYRIRRTGRGTFDFIVELAPRYPTGQSFDSEVVMSESDRRKAEWDDVLASVPSLDQIVSMRPSLDEESVTLSPSSWRILSSLGDGRSTAEVSRIIGWSQFRTAREVASLVRGGLVTLRTPTAADLRAAQAVPAAVIAQQEDLGVSDAQDTEQRSGEAQPAAAVAEPHEAEPEASETVDEAEEQEPEVAEPIEVDEVFEDVAEEVAHAEAEAQYEVVGADEAPYDDTSVNESSDGEASDDDASDGEASDGEAAEFVADDSEGGFEAALPVQDVADAFETDEAHEPAAETAELPASESASSAGSWWTEEDADQPETPWGADPWQAGTPSEEPVIETSPWSASITSSDDEAEPSVVPESDAPAAVVGDSEGDDAERGWVSPQPEEAKSGGWWSETMGGAEEEDPDSEADRFLESVFSSLSDDEPGKSDKDDDSGFGMGLLRRRRLGAAARDIDSDR